MSHLEAILQTAHVDGGIVHIYDIARDYGSLNTNRWKQLTDINIEMFPEFVNQRCKTGLVTVRVLVLHSGTDFASLYHHSVTAKEHWLPFLVFGEGSSIFLMIHSNGILKKRNL